MIRLTLLALFVAFLCVYAWRDWYKSLCGLILMMAVIEHPDMPKELMGIQGLNPWNITLLFVVMAWAKERRNEGLKWDMPGGTTFLLVVYLITVLIGFFRLLGQSDQFFAVYAMQGLEVPGIANLWSEFIINTIKWVLPGLLLFDGCRNRTRLNWAVVATLGIYLLLAVQVIRWMPMSTITSGAQLTERSLKILVNEVGYHRVNLAVMLAGAAWAIFAVRPLTTLKAHHFWISAASLVTVFGLALTGGRAGYATWAAVGFLLAMLRWRKYLIIAPIIVGIVISFVPAVQERFTQGFTAETRDTNERLHGAVQIQGGEPDAYTITAGRNVAWPYVIDKIADAPFFGYGREGMQTTGTSARLWAELGENFPHPHNAYLQALLDNGFVGAVPIFLLYLILLKRSVSLFRDSRSPMFIAVGGMALGLVVALLIGSMGSQSFYPREGSVGMWCAIGLMMRVYVERAKAIAVSVSDRSQVSRVGNVELNLWRPAVESSHT